MLAIQVIIPSRKALFSWSNPGAVISFLLRLDTVKEFLWFLTGPITCAPSAWSHCCLHYEHSEERFRELYPLHRWLFHLRAAWLRCRWRLPQLNAFVTSSLLPVTVPVSRKVPPSGWLRVRLPTQVASRSSHSVRRLLISPPSSGPCFRTSSREPRENIVRTELLEFSLDRRTLTTSRERERKTWTVSLSIKVPHYGFLKMNFHAMCNTALSCKLLNLKVHCV